MNPEPSIHDTEIVIEGFDPSYKKMQTEIKKIAFALEKIFDEKAFKIIAGTDFSGLKEMKIAKPTLMSYWPVIRNGGAMRKGERVLESGDWGLFMPGSTLQIPASKTNNASLIFLATPL